MNIYIENQNDILHETSVDFILRPCAKEIHIVQYDKSLPVIKVELFRNGERYVLPENAIVNVRVGKIDHTFVYESVLGTNQERNIVYFEVSEQMATIAGRISPVIEIIEGSKVACSSPIQFIIERNPIQEGQIESHDDFPIIYELQGSVADHEERIQVLESHLEGEAVTLHTDQYNIDGKKGFTSDIYVDSTGNLSLYYDISDQYHATNKKYVDTAIQEAVEGIEIRSDVIDVLGTYQDLQNYDTTDVSLNDLIKIISDETHNNATSYYRWQEVSGTNQWKFVTSEGPYYTISQSEERFVNVSNNQEIYGMKYFHDIVIMDTLWFNSMIGSEEGGPTISYDNDYYGYFYHRILGATVGNVDELEFIHLEDSNNQTDYTDPSQIRLLNIADPISDTDASNKRYTDRKLELHQFDGFVGGSQVHDQIMNGEMMYCQSGTQTDVDPSESPLIQIRLDQASATVSNRKAMYIKQIIITYELDSEPGVEKIWSFEITSRLFAHISGGSDIEPKTVTLTDSLSGVSLDWTLIYLPTSGKTYYGAYDANKGQQFGSNSNPAELIILQTTSLQNCTVKDIKVYVSGGSGTRAQTSIDAALDQWDVEGSYTPSITASNTEYDFTHGEEGTHLGSGSGTTTTYEHVFLRKEEGDVTIIEPRSDYLYILEDGSQDSYRLYKYVNLAMQEVSKTRLGTTSDTAYRGDYGQDNYNKLNQVRTQTFTFTGEKTFASDTWFEASIYVNYINSTDEDSGYQTLARYNSDGYYWMLENVSTIGQDILPFMQAENSNNPGPGYIVSLLNADSYRIMNLADPINDTDAVNKKYADTKVEANTAITGATKCKITYDAKGLVTGGADLAASDIPSLDTSKITTGTFADARIASASAWNAKYDKPNGGIPASDLADTYVLANTAITGATKCKITYDAKGLVTGGADLAASDIPSLDTSKITTGTFADARIASANTWNAKTKVNLNGSDVITATIYAPITSGTNGQILKSTGAGSAPVWIDMPTSLIDDVQVEGQSVVVAGIANITKAGLGLDNVDNTSDAIKKADFTGSIASGNTGFVTGSDAYTELNKKVDKTTTVNGHALSSNVTVTKGDVGLGNVDNTSDLNKPISNTTQAALNLKADKSELPHLYRHTIRLQYNATSNKGVVEIDLYINRSSSFADVSAFLSYVLSENTQKIYCLASGGILRSSGFYVITNVERKFSNGAWRLYLNGVSTSDGSELTSTMEIASSGAGLSSFSDVVWTIL